ncbi:2-phospho-L-lactate guanylyltransferase [Mangrovihabitans endophyticus]|uniref:Phosphoenolpyruvate guanylyltransferase n=2 Tax=Mangrovihabitans endophyticus TaxID=1751298 RepID=A0A8J3C2X3_9ACTN|nr:2-phospho-L-lactate guanylyltransferase [Mangrovihabitans endophyticus]
MTWTAVIPVKRLPVAKSRLRGAVAPDRHEELVLAMVQDTLAAVRACPAVRETLVITDDPAVSAAAGALGARTAPDAPDGGLNAAMRYGADELAGPAANRFTLTADLPALRDADLSAALEAGSASGAAPGRWFVPDAAGTGTVLLAAAAGARLDPRFGPGSAAAHARSGARAWPGDWPRLRQDVDTAADLRAVLALGPGPRTAALLRDLGRTGGRGSARRPAA